MTLPRPVKKLIESFERLPGIGPKTAQRLTFYLLHVPQIELDEFSKALSELKKNTVLCSVCFNVSETNPCPICTDPVRDKDVICVVEQPLDVLALEKTGKYKGLYHVLHGAISPLNNIGPDELYINQLLDRISLRFRESTYQSGSNEITEIILATNPNMEGEATAMYIKDQLLKIENLKLKISRLGQGLPTGGDLEYADEVTLSRALEGRREY
ncbi:recombination protein RecR [Candidatus Gottesmanbacteria bacterium]|nr:recombination protein RecR [Candidatus Gottesmanbacteria bacterium]